MFNSGFSLFGRSSNSWDTSCARQLLQIPQDQLTMIDSIPKWSNTEKEISPKKVSENEIILEAVVNPLTIEIAKSVDLVSKSSSSIQNTNSKPKEKSQVPSSNEKLEFLHNVSLCSCKVIDDIPSIRKRKRSSSVPDISRESVGESLSSSKSETNLEDISCTMSTEQSILSKSKKSPTKKHQLLDATYVIPSVLDDKTNSIPNISDAHSGATESPVMVSKKRTFEKLGSHISNHPFLKESASLTVPKFGGLPVFSTTTVQRQVSLDNVLSKKLQLLERRFSPSKEYGLLLSGEDINSKDNLRNNHSQNLSVSYSDSFAVGPASQTNIRSLNKVHDKDKNSLKAAPNTVNDKISPVVVYVQSPEKASKKQNEGVSIDVKTSQKNYAEGEAALKSNMTTFEEESFISQPIPCGQPPPINTHASNQSNLLNGSEIKSIAAQDVDCTMKKMALETFNTPLNVSSGYHNIQVEDSATEKVVKVCGKRKRKSKSDKPSKKSLGTKSLVHIKYTADQISNMIEIMKVFQAEM